MRPCTHIIILLALFVAPSGIERLGGTIMVDVQITGGFDPHRLI